MEAGPETAGGEWTPDDQARFDRERLDRLSQFVLDTFPDEISPELGDVEVVAIAMRLLQRYADHPNGRLEPVVRMVVDQLEDLPGDAQGLLDLATSVRVTLAGALTAAPRPGGGPEPVYETDDITLVRFDRDRFRVELEAACLQIAAMYIAGTGREGLGPVVGPVEDLADEHARRLTAERSLANVLAGSSPVLTPGTLEYAQLHRIVQDMVRALTGPPVKAKDDTSVSAR